MNTLLLALALTGFVQKPCEAPTGLEWQDPQQLACGKELPHTWMFSFEDEKDAIKVLPEYSTLWMSLNGTWKFNWVPNPPEVPGTVNGEAFYASDYDASSWDDISVPSNWNVFGIGQDGSQRYGTPIYVNVNVPYWHEIKIDDWKGGVTRDCPQDWTMFAARNEVGSYRRMFTLPEQWEGNDIFLDFDGVDSFFYLWVNGKYVGFSKNSRNLAQFNITNYVTFGGENSVAVAVYRNSDGSQLEAQDMFRLPGIFRTVAVEAKPKVSFRDLKVTPSTSGKLHVEASISTDSMDDYTIHYALYENKLYSDEATLVADFPDRSTVADIYLPNPKLWSAEAPHMYTLVGVILNKEDYQVVDIVSVQTGFREVCIRDTEAADDEFGIAGKYFYLNGKTVKLRGVNRHETEPSMGHAITHEVMERDIMMLKQANINHVRNSHYNDDPYWYYLCDRYGIYLMDEANIESHHYGYGPESLSHVPEFKAAHLARMAEMVAAHYNHPAILIWSMGNESGPGDNFKATYELAHSMDPMRPVQYERNNGISDFGSCMYPSVGTVREIASGTADVVYPYHIVEFAHSMGNALGDFVDYWEYINATNFITGACVWDWVDQGLWNWTPDGYKYIAYGGDFGDTPNDGQFVMNGLIEADRLPKPQYYEVKKVYQPIKASLCGDGKVDLFNKNYYKSITVDVKWTYLSDGHEVESGMIEAVKISPRAHLELAVPCVETVGETFLNLQFFTTADLPWANAGWEIAKEQLYIGGNQVNENADVEGTLVANRTKTGAFAVTGGDFKLVFNTLEGTIHSLSYKDKEILCPDFGPQLNVMRAFINNDQYFMYKWYENGLYKLNHSVSYFSWETKTSGEAAAHFQITSKADCGGKLIGGYQHAEHTVVDVPENTDVVSFTTTYDVRVDASGKITVSMNLDSDRHELVLPRIGLLFKVPAEYSNVKFYGRGPGENYSDRQTASFVGIHESTVSDQLTRYVFPQECGNHEQVRWMQMTNAEGQGFKISALGNSQRRSESGDPVFSFQALPYTSEAIMHAGHPHELPEPGDTYLTIDIADLGLGGGSCGPAPMAKDLVFGYNASLTFSIEPIGF